jgi:hypothetical protein
MAAPNTGFDQALIAATRNYLSTQLVDAIFEAMKYIGVCKKYGGLKGLDGGYSIVQPIEYATNPTVRSARAWDELTIRETDEMTMAEYTWKMLDGAIAVSQLDIARATGKEKKIELMKTKIRNLERSCRQMLNQQCFTGSTSVATNVLGLTQLVAATGTVGGIDSTSLTWWQSFVDSSAEALSVADMETAYLTASNNEAPPQVIVTTQTLFEKYMDLTRAKQSVNMPQAERVAELGFDAAQFKGRPVIWDTDCPTGYMFFLNFDFLKLGYHQDFNWKVSPPNELDRQHVLAQKVLWFGEHFVTNRRMQARLQAKTA